MVTHTAQVRGRKIAWDVREVVQHGLNSDVIKLDLDAEWRECDAISVVLCDSSLREPKRFVVNEDRALVLPPSMLSETGPFSTCVIGYKGGARRIVTAQERYPLVVVGSGCTGPLDPGEEQPDLWGQLMLAEAARIEAELAREAAETARADAEAKRAEAEKARETASAEAVRAASDAAAKAEEAARQAESRVTVALAEVAKAEQARDEAEEGRAAAESSRAEAEAARIAAESKRESAEAKRKADSAKAVADASAATSAANAAAGKADAAAQTATDGEASRVAAETARAKAEQARAIAETGRVEAEATRAAHESKRTETFNTNLVSWNGKVDAACKKATDTASKAAQDAKTATDAAIAKTEEATQAAVAKAQTATDNATTAANKAEAAVSKLPLPLGNTLKGEAEATLVNVDDAYPAPLVTTKVMGQSNQQQEPAPSPENPQEITNLTKAELVITGKNLINPNRLAQIDSSYYQAVDGQLKVIKSQNAEWKDVPIYGTLQAGTYTLSGDNIEIRDTALNQIVVIMSTQVKQFTLNNPTAIKMKIGYGLPKYPVITKVQLEVGSKATAYEPTLKPKATSIDLKGNELCSLPNGVKDEVVIDAEGNVSLIKRVTSTPVTSDIIQIAGEHENGQKYVTVVLNNCVRDEKPNVMCSTYMSSTWTDSDKQIYILSSIGAVITDSRFADKETAANILTAMNLTIFYQLAEPQTIPLGKVELPALPEATSNVWNDGNIPANVYIQYLKDVNIAFADLESKLTQAVVAAAANL